MGVQIDSYLKTGAVPRSTMMGEDRAVVAAALDEEERISEIVVDDTAIDDTNPDEYYTPAHLKDGRMQKIGEMGNFVAVQFLMYGQYSEILLHEGPVPAKPPYKFVAMLAVESADFGGHRVPEPIEERLVYFVQAAWVKQSYRGKGVVKLLYDAILFGLNGAIHSDEKQTNAGTRIYQYFIAHPERYSVFVRSWDNTRHGDRERYTLINPRNRKRQHAKAYAQTSNGLIVVASNPNDHEYTGLSESRDQLPIRATYNKANSDGEELSVLLDPGVQEFIGFIRRTPFQSGRGIILHDEEGKEHLIVWDANDVLHHEVEAAAKASWNWIDHLYTKLEFQLKQVVPQGQQTDEDRSADWIQLGPIWATNDPPFVNSRLGQGLRRLGAPPEPKPDTNLTEARSEPVLFHALNTGETIAALERGSFQLGIAKLGGGVDTAYQKDHPYYLSMAHSANARYGRDRRGGVTIEFNRDYLKSRYRIVPIDYWGGSTTTDRAKAGAGPDLEQEDRLLSKQPELPIPSTPSEMIRAIHLLVTADDWGTRIERKLIMLCKRMGIPIHLYDHHRKFPLAMPAATTSISKLMPKFRKPPREGFGGGVSPAFKLAMQPTFQTPSPEEWKDNNILNTVKRRRRLSTYRELLFKKDIAELSPAAKKLLGDVQWEYREQSVINTMDSDIHYERSMDRAEAHAMTQAMHKFGIATPKDYVMFVRKKWANPDSEQDSR